MRIAYRAGQTYFLVGAGDSISNGHAMPSSTFTYQRHASDKLGGVSWVNKGVDGQNTTQILARYATDVIAYSPSITIVEGGNNDLGGMDVNLSIQNLKDMVDMCVDNGVLLVVWLPIMYNTSRTAENQLKADDINNQMTAWMGANHPTHLIVNVDAPLIAGGTIDGVHPSAKGYLGMGKIIGDAILEYESNL